MVNTMNSTGRSARSQCFRNSFDGAAIDVAVVPSVAQQKSCRFVSAGLVCSVPQGAFGPFGQQLCVGTASPQANAGTPAASKLSNKIGKATMRRNIS